MHSDEMKRRAYVLIEMLIVMGLIGLLLSVSVISLQAVWGNSGFRNQAQELVNLFQMAQEAAAQSDRRYAVILYFTDQMYILREFASTDLETIPDDEFRQLVENEAKRPEPTAAHIARAFKELLRTKLQKKGLLILANLEMLFVYNIELELLRIMAADENHILLLLPGRRMSGKIIMFPGLVEESSYMLPTNLIAENHLWELRENR